jgi:hypothetical protein
VFRLQKVVNAHILTPKELRLCRLLREPQALAPGNLGRKVHQPQYGCSDTSKYLPDRRNDLDIFANTSERGRMDQTSRAQIRRLILEDADVLARRAVETSLKEIYAKHAAKGSLRSGATIKAAVTALEEIAAGFVTRSVDRVTPVAKDTEAFSMLQEAVEGFLRFLSGKVDSATQIATGADRDGAIQGRITEATRGLYGVSESTLRRQLEIHRFTFTVPQTPLIDPAVLGTPARSDAPTPSHHKNRRASLRAGKRALCLNKNKRVQ